MTGLVVLLPPSEGKAAGGRGRFALRSGSFRALAPARDEVAEALARAARGSGAAKLFGVGGDALARAVALSCAIVSSETLPAHERYCGVVWRHLDAPSLSGAARARAEAGVIVVSGLLGLVAFADPVPDYRCKMGAVLPPLGKVSRWWRPRLNDALAGWVRGATVVDLLPNEHADALDRAAVAEACRRYVRVEFTRGSGGAAGHGAKAAKGLAARALLAAPATKLEQVLEGFRVEPGTPIGAWRFAGADVDGAVTTVRIATGRTRRTGTRPRLDTGEGP